MPCAVPCLFAPLSTLAHERSQAGERRLLAPLLLVRHRETLPRHQRHVGRVVGPESVEGVAKVLRRNAQLRGGRRRRRGRSLRGLGLTAIAAGVARPLQWWCQRKGAQQCFRPWSLSRRRPTDQLVASSLGRRCRGGGSEPLAQGECQPALRIGGGEAADQLRRVNILKAVAKQLDGREQLQGVARLSARGDGCIRVNGPEGENGLA